MNIRAERGGQEPGTFTMLRQVAAGLPLFERPSNMARLNSVLAGITEVNKLTEGFIAAFGPNITRELASALAGLEVPQKRAPDYNLVRRVVRLGNKTLRDLDELEIYDLGAKHIDWRKLEEELGYEIRPHTWKR